MDEYSQMVSPTPMDVSLGELKGVGDAQGGTYCSYEVARGPDEGLN